MTNEEMALAVQQGASCAPLWEAVQKLVYLLAWKQYIGKRERCASAGVTLEDLQQEGYIATVEAAKAYDPEKPYSFNAYLRYTLQNRVNALVGLRTARQQHEPIHNATSLDTPLQGAEDVNLIDTLEDASAYAAMEQVEARIDAQCLHDALEGALGEIPRDQADIIRARYYGGQSVKEAAAARQIPVDKAQACYNNGILALRKPKAAKHIRPWLDDLRYSYGIRGTGVQQYKYTHTSATEWGAIKMLEIDR